MVEPKRATFKIVIKKVEKPFSNESIDDFEWLCQSLGFFELIDREKTASGIFKVILAASERGVALTSSAIAEQVNMSRGSVINHLNNLIRSGLILKVGRYYEPRSKSMLRTIEEIQEDVDRIFSKMKKTACEIDSEIGIAPPSNE